MFFGFQSALHPFAARRVMDHDLPKKVRMKDIDRMRSIVKHFENKKPASYYDWVIMRTGANRGSVISRLQSQGARGVSFSKFLYHRGL